MTLTTFVVDPLDGTGEAYVYQYNTQFDPHEYDQNYYDDPYADPYPPVEPEADQDGNRTEPLVEEGKTVEHGRSWRPENSGSMPPREAAETELSTTSVDSPAGVYSRISLQAALQQWGRAYAHISRKRREAVISATDTRVEYLLKDEAIFTSGKEAHEHLFTGEFLNPMLKEASQDKTLARRDQAAAATSRGRRNPIRMVVYGHFTVNSASRDYGDDFQPASRGRSRGRGDSRVGHGRGISRGRFQE
uniref:Uncharacterized protein n=1 Tax=Daphnia galeata TaxID=27404 RepID=A0A8J2RR55_9CRUS|nr:unnamed protein product [Daphnia galeata]